MDLILPEMYSSRTQPFEDFTKIKQKLIPFCSFLFNSLLFGNFWSNATFNSYRIVFGISYSIDPEKMRALSSQMVENKRSWRGIRWSNDLIRRSTKSLQLTRFTSSYSNSRSDWPFHVIKSRRSEGLRLQQLMFESNVDNYKVDRRLSTICE